MTAYNATNLFPMDALPTTTGVVQTIRAVATNDGASTYAPDGLAATPIFGLGGQQLQGGEIVEGGAATLVSFIGPLLNGGSLCWVLLRCDGGAQQVAPATQGDHAVQLQQLQNAVAGVSQGRLLRRSIYVNVAGALQVSVNGSAFASASSTFQPLPQTNAVDVQVQGGGGSGGGAAATADGQVSAGAGGGAGGYARKWLTTGFSGVAVSASAGGAPATGVSGNHGGDSAFGATVKATGGSGGASLPAAAPTGNPFGSASGGAGFGGDTNSRGAQGSYCLSFPDAVSGGGGASIFGSGGYFGPAPSSSTNPVSADLNATSYGAGGAGAANLASSAAAASGSGMSGIVIVDEYSA
jgi:hypothetical protein